MGQTHNCDNQFDNLYPDLMVTLKAKVILMNLWKLQGDKWEVI